MNEQPERIPDEKVEIVFHQGKRLGRCFGEHTFNFSSGASPIHFYCNSSSDFYRRTVSKAAEDLGRRMAEDLDKKIMETLFNPRKPGVK